ncbi:MAG: hypothetical protein MUO85_01145 [candidate division Zixibacteria bacterium]|nr:hypothetical protein [candidate division Zixibacteria bacterium]
MLGAIQGWLVSGMGGLVLVVLGWLIKKHLVPLLATDRARKLAQHILLIADEVTDYFLQKYPGKDWAEWLNQAIDKIMEITGIDKEIAERAIRAALERKK